MNTVATPTAIPSGKPASSVSEVSQLIQGLLKSEPKLTNVRIIGEVSGHSQPPSGHSYFSLRDREASLRCVMFRYGRGHQFLEDGAQVICEGSAGIYAPRGDLQIVVTSAEPAGLGDQQAQLEELRRKLRAEGLFDPSRKRSIPQFPKRIAVVTSEQGAVWHDIVNIVQRRYPLLELILVPSAVQGEMAPVSIIEALADLHAYAETEHVDAVIVGRGGGSPEDLMPYNDEMVARTIFASRIPVISAVGHETDFTIADDVADMRAPTPSAAAELVSPSASDLDYEMREFSGRLAAVVSERIDQTRQRLDISQDRFEANMPNIDTRRKNLDEMVTRVDKGALRHRTLILTAMKRFDEQRIASALEKRTRIATQSRDALISRLFSAAPSIDRHRERIVGAIARISFVSGRVTADQRQKIRRVDESRLRRALATRSSLMRQRIDAVDDRLVRVTPDTARDQVELSHANNRLKRAIENRIAQLRGSLKPRNAALSALAPDRILERGYVIVRNDEGGIITRRLQVNLGDIMEITFADGEVAAEIIDADGPNPSLPENAPRKSRRQPREEQAKFI